MEVEVEDFDEVEVGDGLFVFNEYDTIDRPRSPAAKSERRRRRRRRNIHTIDGPRSPAAKSEWGVSFLLNFLSLSFSLSQGSKTEKS